MDARSRGAGELNRAAAPRPSCQARAHKPRVQNGLIMGDRRQTCADGAGTFPPFHSHAVSSRLPASRRTMQCSNLHWYEITDDLPRRTANSSRSRRIVGYRGGLPVTSSPHSFCFFGGAAFVIRALASLGASLLRPGWESFDKHSIFKPGAGRSTVSSGLLILDRHAPLNFHGPFDGLPPGWGDVSGVLRVCPPDGVIPLRSAFDVHPFVGHHDLLCLSFCRSAVRAPPRDRPTGGLCSEVRPAELPAQRANYAR
jgi:hypothetical protein